MNKKRHSKFRFPAGVAALLSAFALSACSASVNTIEKANPEARPTLENDRRVVTDAGTRDMASLIGIRTGTTPDGSVLKIQLEVMNRTRDVGRLAWLVEWFDAQGMKIAVPAAWIPLAIAPAKIESIVAVAPNADAKDFRISLKRTE